MEKKEKVYSKGGIILATILGTPLAGGYLIGKNFAVLEDRTAKKISYTLGILSTSLVLIALLYIPYELIEKVPRMFVPLIYAVIIERLFVIYQQDKIEEHLKNEELIQSNWKAAGVGVVGSILAVILLFGISFTQPLYPGHVKEYRLTKDQVFYDEEIRPSLSDKLAQALIQYEFFHNDFQTAAHIGKRDEFYVITLPVQKEHWNDKESQRFFMHLKEDLKTKFGTKT